MLLLHGARPAKPERRRERRPQRLDPGGRHRGFRDQLRPVSVLGILHVGVTAPLITDPRIPGYDRPKIMAIRNRITKELEGVGARDVMVSVRSSLV